MSGHGGGVELPESHGNHNDPFTKKVALCVAIYAVILAVAGTGGKNAGKDMLGEQIDSTTALNFEMNEWNQFQAKSIREAIYQNDKENLEYDIKNGLIKPEDKTKLEDKLKTKSERIAKYEKDKAELKEKAEGFREKRKKHEESRNLAHKKDGYFDYAELLIQIAIVLASVTMLSGARWAFFVSLGLVAAGLVLTLNGYMLFMHLGFIEGH